MKRKNNLDEMQEQKLKQIEHTGFWLFFWGLFAAIMVQSVFLTDMLPAAIAGEMIIFLPVCCWMVVQCLRHGIWGRRLKADPKTNLLASLVAGLVVGVVGSLTVYRNFGSLAGAAAAFVFGLLFAFGLCFALLSLCASVYKKKLRRLEKEPESGEA